MNHKSEEKVIDQTPKWLVNLTPLIAIALGGVAFWYAWLKYNNIVNQPEFHWYIWISPVLMVLVGVLCLAATILFIVGRTSAWSVFMGGVSIIPLILFSNLVIFIFRIIQNTVQGNADPFLSRLSTSPLRTILTIIVIVILLSMVEGIKKVKNNN